MFLFNFYIKYLLNELYLVVDNINDAEKALSMNVTDLYQLA